MMKTPITVSDCCGQNARITRLDLPETESLRLKSLGIFEGQSIQSQKMGNTFVLAAAGSRVAVAAELAANIHVEPSA
jgi:Fe2+ transport system protein FeoA